MYLKVLAYGSETILVNVLLNSDQHLHGLMWAKVLAIG